MPHFKWDKNKAWINLRKHGISFEEATSIFRDDYSLTLDDKLHSFEEERFIDVGRSMTGRILVVTYTERGKDIRIITCRKATNAERKMYEEQNS
jgi:uncharacterized DUF497 family protein